MSEAKYEVKGIKTFLGMEGHGYNATLYRDGKRVATLIDDASGGPLNVHWNDMSAPKVDGQLRTYTGDLFARKMTPEEALFQAYILDKTYEFQGETHHETEETYLGGIVEEALKRADAKKLLKRVLKKGIAFIQGDELLTISRAYTPEMGDQVKAKYPGAILLNGMSEEEAIEAILRIL